MAMAWARPSPKAQPSQTFTSAAALSAYTANGWMAAMYLPCARWCFVCQFSGVNVPPLFGNDAPLVFGNNAPPLFGQMYHLLKGRTPLKD